MKTFALIGLTLLMSISVSKGDGEFEKAMKDALDNLEQASTVEGLRPIANQFDRIASVKKDNWLPLYHAAYARVLMAAMQTDNGKKDQYLDAAQLNLDEVEKLKHDTSERMALQGFLYMIRMSVDPGRGMELGVKCGGMIQQAYEMNSQNPRAVLMLAQFKFGSAQFMGSDTSEACGLFDETLLLLDKADSDADDSFLPRWGRNIALYNKQQCGE
jgi:hypothetical protein